MLALLALIGLEKFRGFQEKPEIKLRGSIILFEEKASRGQLRSGGECRKVSGVRGTAPERVWGSRGEKRVIENAGSECNFDKQLATGL